MLSSAKLMRAIATASLTILFSTSLAFAGDPDPNANPVLAGIIKLGAKAYFMGSRDGLDGWFIIKDGRVQISYSTADKKHLIIGAIFGPNGQNVTAEQVKALLETNKEVSGILAGAAKAQGEEQATSAAAAPTAAPAQSLTPGEQMMQEMTTAAGVTLGTGKAKLFMIMDPNCPHCQATWKALRDAVFKGQLQIFMIPITAPGSENEKVAAQLLRASDPLTVWDKYVAGDKAQLAGKPEAAQLDALHSNRELAQRWNIQLTPYLLYRGKDGKIKVLQGEPEKMAALLADLVP